jgi:hypothetical protein
MNDPDHIDPEDTTIWCINVHRIMQPQCKKAATHFLRVPSGRLRPLCAVCRSHFDMMRSQLTKFTPPEGLSPIELQLSKYENLDEIVEVSLVDGETEFRKQSTSPGKR